MEQPIHTYTVDEQFQHLPDLFKKLSTLLVYSRLLMTKDALEKKHEIVPDVLLREIDRVKNEACL